MRPAQLKKICLSMPGAVEEFPFGATASVFKVAGKMFALTSLGGKPLQVNLKCDPDLAVALRLKYPEVLPGYHLNKRHWNTVRVDAGLADQLVRELVEDSYDLVVAGLPRRQREKLRWVGLANEGGTESNSIVK